MTTKETLNYIIDFVIDEYSFERLNEYQEDSKFAEYSYKKFLQFNKKCIEELPKKDVEFLEMLGKNFLNESVKMVDEDLTNLGNIFEFHFHYYFFITIISETISKTNESILLF